MLTLEQARALEYGDMLHSTVDKNADGTCRRWKVNGAVKTWKRDAERIRVPLKHGLYSYDAITEADFHDGICGALRLGKTCDCGGW